MKKILLIIAGLYSIDGYSQDSTKKTITEPAFVFEVTTKYIKIEDRTSFRFPNFNHGSRNIRLVKIKNNVIRCDSLNDSNQIVYSAECILDYSEHNYTMFGDSIDISSVNKNVLGTDSTMPREIITYDLILMRNGKYIEYYPNGKIKVEGFYWRNLKIKKWKHYDEDGRLIRSEKYKQGIIQK